MKKIIYILAIMLCFASCSSYSKEIVSEEDEFFYSAFEPKIIYKNSIKKGYSICCSEYIYVDMNTGVLYYENSIRIYVGSGGISSVMTPIMKADGTCKTIYDLPDYKNILSKIESRAKLPLDKN